MGFGAWFPSCYSFKTVAAVRRCWTNLETSLRPKMKATPIKTNKKGLINASRGTRAQGMLTATQTTQMKIIRYWPVYVRDGIGVTSATCCAEAKSFAKPMPFEREGAFYFCGSDERRELVLRGQARQVSANSYGQFSSTIGLWP